MISPFQYIKDANPFLIFFFHFSFFMQICLCVETTKTLSDIAKVTYEKALPCLLSTWMMADRKISEFKFPDDAEAHFKDILDKTARFRSMPIHSYANYDGPWIENIFVANYSTIDLSHFHGFIPIFAQWIDTQILRGRHFDNLLHALNSVLRPNVLYLTISQGDVGLGKIGMSHPNIFVLSAGGFGHVVAPLIRGELPWSDLPLKFEQDIGFFGNANQHQSNRPAMLEAVRTAVDKLGVTYRQAQGDTWMRDMQVSKYNLAPRGYGRSSFRFSEAIQMGRMPVFLYDDYPWIPYLGTDADVSHFGFRGGLWDQNHSLPVLVESLKNLTDAQYHEKMNYLSKIRKLFTYEGFFQQFELFLRDPFGSSGGHLVCAVHPKSERCCG